MEISRIDQTSDRRAATNPLRHSKATVSRPESDCNYSSTEKSVRQFPAAHTTLTDEPATAVVNHEFPLISSPRLGGFCGYDRPQKPAGSGKICRTGKRPGVIDEPAAAEICLNFQRILSGKTHIFPKKRHRQSPQGHPAVNSGQDPTLRKDPLAVSNSHPPASTCFQPYAAGGGLSIVILPMRRRALQAPATARVRRGTIALRQLSSCIACVP